VTTQPDTDAPPTCSWRDGSVRAELCGNPLPCSRHGHDVEGHPFGFTVHDTEESFMADAPQEGRPTTPQTEADHIEAGYREAVPDLLRSLVKASQATPMFRLVAYRWIEEREAAAGALPSVEAPLTCECGKPLALSHIAWDPNYTPHTPRARLAAAPPEASER
jgi:hypothetical protein